MFQLAYSYEPEVGCPDTPMIVNAGGTHVVAGGWAAAPQSIWWCYAASEQVRGVNVPDTDSVEVGGGAADTFTAVHSRRNLPPSFSVRRISNPKEVLSSVSYVSGAWRFHGDTSAWRPLPRFYTDHSAVFLLDVERFVVERLELEWYTESQYDLAYQGIVGVWEVPGHDLVIISVQRDSYPVLLNTVTHTLLRKLSLANRTGNPVVRFRSHAPEVWISDYDSLVRVSLADWQPLGALRVQQDLAVELGGKSVSSQAFIGDFAFNAPESICAVARPHSGDIALIDVTSLSIVETCWTGGWPTEVAILNDGRILAKDGRTGDLLRASIHRG